MTALGTDHKLTQNPLAEISSNQIFNFHIDWEIVGADLAVSCNLPRSREILHGRFDEQVERLSRANDFGANIMVSLAEHPVVWVRAGMYGVARTRPTIVPNTTVEEGALWEWSYWRVDGMSMVKREQLLKQLANHYRGDHEASDCHVLHFVPGFIRHATARLGSTHMICTTDRHLLHQRPKRTGVIVADALAESLTPLPRQTPADRITEIKTTISDELPLFPTENESLIEHLERAIIVCTRRGFDTHESIGLCMEINRRHRNPINEDEIVLACHREKEHHDKELSTATSASLFSIRSARVDCFLDYDPPRPRWLLKDCLSLGKAGMVVARGGTGKSWFAMQLAISVGTGHSFIQVWDIVEHGKVLALFAEDDEDEIHRRFRAAVNAAALSAPDQVEYFKRLRENVFIKSVVGKDNRMTSSERSKEVIETEYLDLLVSTIRHIGPWKLIIIDPVSRFRGGQENSAEDTTRFVATIEKLVRETGATVLLVHHVNKWSGNSSEAMQEASRGSSALTDGVRWQMNLAVMTPSEAKDFALSEDDRHLYLTAQVTKTNSGPPQPKVILKRGDGGVLTCVELTSAKRQKAVNVIERIVQLVLSEAKRGALYSKTSFEDEFGGADKLLETGKVALRKLLNDALNTGKLVLHNRKLALPGRLLPKAKLRETVELQES